MPKTTKTRVQQHRARMRAAGLVQYTVWIKPGHKSLIRRYAEMLREKQS